SSAARRKGGNDAPRRSARWRIPFAAFGLKKYLDGTGCVSKTSDNEHTTASLGHSEVLSVKHTVGVPIPEFCQRPEDGSHVPSAVGRQKSRDVLDNHPTGTEFIKDASELEEESGPLASQSSTASSHREVLAGEASANKVNWFKLVSANRPHVLASLRLGEVPGQYPAAQRVDLDHPDRRHPGPAKALVEPPDAGEEATDSHGYPSPIPAAASGSGRAPWPRCPGGRRPGPRRALPRGPYDPGRWGR